MATDLAPPLVDSARLVRCHGNAPRTSTDGYVRRVRCHGNAPSHPHLDSVRRVRYHGKRPSHPHLWIAFAVSVATATKSSHPPLVNRRVVLGFNTKKPPKWERRNGMEKTWESTWARQAGSPCSLSKWTGRSGPDIYSVNTKEPLDRSASRPAMDARRHPVRWTNAGAHSQEFLPYDSFVSQVTR